MKRTILLAAALAAAAAPYRQEVEAWRQHYEAGLKADGGWLTVAGLFWLRPGENRVGSAADSEIPLPPGTAPPRAGAVLFEDHRARYQPAGGGRAVELRPDSGSGIAIGRFTLLLIERGGRYAIRLKDPESALRKRFAGLRWYPLDESWRIVARFVPYPAPKNIALDTVVGVQEQMEIPGYVTFFRGGTEYRLEPVREGRGLFFIFRDGTSGKTTYGAGRFLNTEAPRGGTVVLDFNRAVNPPCAYTPYATCPLPPKQNRLSLPIAAGEKTYPGGAH